MRLCLALPLLLACTPAARPGPATPPSLGGSCTVLADGAICRVDNGGGAGGGALRVILADPKRGSVVLSDELQSGPLATGHGIDLAVRFARRPADVCAELDSCVAQVVDAAGADAAVVAWEKQLADERLGGDTTEICARVADRVAELLAAQIDEEAAAVEDAEARAQMIAEAKAMTGETRAQVLAECKASFSSEQAECILAAASLEEAGACAP